MGINTRIQSLVAQWEDLKEQHVSISIQQLCALP